MKNILKLADQTPASGSELAPGHTDSLGNNRVFGSTASLSRFLRYALQNAACTLLPESNITACCKLIVPGRSSVDVLYSDERRRARLGNLCTCGLLWICPVCASGISEKRAALLKAGMSAAKVNPLLLTFTMAHGASQQLAPNLEALLDAYKALTHGRAWVSFEERYGWLTAIRALEVTHGENGWHPHLHVLAFFEQPLHYDESFAFNIELSNLWIAHLSKKNASANIENGVNVRTAKKDAIAYLSKYGRDPVVGADGKSAWGLERELTKAVTKNSRYKGRTPWALLADFIQGDQRAGALFIEYAEAFKGKKQLVIPPAARELLNIDDISDAQLASAPPTEMERLLLALDIEQWKRIMFGDLRQDLMAIANSGSSEQLSAWLKRMGIL